MNPNTDWPWPEWNSPKPASSLFHELGHLLLHGRNAVILEGLDDDPVHLEQEAQADRFAADTLIASSPYRSFVRREKFNRSDIIDFAEKMEVDPGIVVGRLHHDGFMKEQWHNDLRKQFSWR